jgi:hypothetical protein
MSRRILSFALFESKTGLTRDQERFLNKCTKGTWTYNPATGLVDVDGSFDCSEQNLKDFQGVKFGKVGGSFYCSNNNLTSLEGAPQEVRGYFSCRDNKLTTLEGAPQVVSETFNCDNNKLTSLAGAPQVVGWNYYCSNNNLTSLAGAPQKVRGWFSCHKNNLTSLEGAPQKVGGEFWCSVNLLTSLKGAPQEVGGDFNCKDNNLTSLEGAPQEVGGDFECDAFQLEEGEWNLKGWLKVMQEGSPKAQKLILILLPAEELNKEIARDPAGIIMKLKKIWNDENFKETRSKLVWPKGFGEEADLVGDLDDVGF